jgi:hypothetical protein
VDVERLLEEETRGSLASLGPEALLLVYLPPGTSLREAGQPRYCDGGPRAYHRLLPAEPGPIPYAVIARCGGEAVLTAVASHEIVETATNPDPQDPGFRLEASPQNVGFASSGWEPVDPCGLMNFEHHRTLVSGGFSVQRAWSNRAAAGGHDPCVPALRDRAFVGLVPRQSAVRLPTEGATAMVILDASADGPAGPWRVSAVDLTGEQEGQHYVEVHLDRSEVSAGDSVTLTLRLVRPRASRVSIVGLVSTLDGVTHLWPLAVNHR